MSTNDESNLQGLFKRVYAKGPAKSSESKKKSSPKFESIKKLLQRISGRDYINKPLGFKE